jgi:YidC/Oxa1 family membrane protein insertase
MREEQVRTLVAFILIIAILLLWTLFSKPRSSARAPVVPIAKDTLVMEKESPAVIVNRDTIAIDRPNYRIVLATAGGSVKSFYLKRYRAEFVPEEQYLFVTRFPGMDSVINFKYNRLGDSVIFSAVLKGNSIKKSYYFNDSSGFALSIQSDSIASVLSLNAGLRVTETKNRLDDLRHFGVYIKDKNCVNIAKKIKDVYQYRGSFEWFSMRTKYFALIINNPGRIESLDFRKILPALDKKISGIDDDRSPVNAAFGCGFGGGSTVRFGAEIPGDHNLKINVRLLPLRHDILARYNQGYQAMAELGLWGFIARIILLIFNFFYLVFRNYGVAIILFAILLKAVFFPLSRKMIVSQYKMQMLQPELKKIQAKYKNDSAALNQEMMHLYKTYKVNPFSGCLPLLIQFPIFMALYQALNTSIEFRQAHFVFWLTDLSIKDPFYVLPIGMGVMMLIQSLMTPIDPRQRFMVVIMPLFMIFIFLNLPSGLQLYWFTYNILTLVENYIVKRGGVK